MFDCPPDIIPPWQIVGSAYCTRVRMDFGTGEICALSKAYFINNAALVPDPDAPSTGECLNGN